MKNLSHLTSEEILQNSPISDVRVRFAPSPTGFLHVGGLRTALYNYLFAKKHGGKFILRIEDTDRTRYVEGAVENLISTLGWSGLTFDEGPHVGGSFGPYVQSERLELYTKEVKGLLESGFAYKCFCTPERLEQMRLEQQKMSLPPKYDRLCTKLTPDQVEEKEKAGIPFVIRMKVLAEVVRFNDVIRGEVSFDSNNIDDQVLLKSDGYPTYHLANVVDDHYMRITHVIRGEEWLSSTPKHILLYEYFGWQAPIFAHLPLLLNPDRTKLSKRQGDVAVEDYKKQGYQKEALINFIAFLGWNPGDEREIFSLFELEKEFSLDRVGKSGAVFNIEKLNWINGQHLRLETIESLLNQLKPILETYNIKASDEYLKKVIRCMRERVNFLHEFITVSSYFFKDPEFYDQEAISKRWKETTSTNLKKLCEKLSLISSFDHDSIQKVVVDFAQEFNLKTSELVHPIRLAISGVSVGPSLYELMEVLGKDVCLKRIEKAMEIIDSRI